MILFPSLRKTLVYRILEEIRSAIETHDFITRRKTVHLTASFGIAEFPEDGSESKDIIHSADTALYKAKETGRNKVVLFNQDKI